LIQSINQLIEQYGKNFYIESKDFLTELNKDLILETVVKTKHSSLLFEEMAYFDLTIDYIPLYKYSVDDILPFISDTPQFIEMKISTIQNICFVNSRINILINKFAENNRIKSEISEANLIDLNLAGIIEYGCELTSDGTQFVVKPIQEKIETFSLAKVHDLLMKINDAILYSTKNINTYNVKVGLVAVGLGVSLFGEAAFANDQDSMNLRNQVKNDQELLNQGNSNRLNDMLLKSIHQEFYDYFHNDISGHAIINHSSSSSGLNKVENFTIEIQDRHKLSCNMEFSVGETGEVSANITKNDFGDFCKEELTASSKVFAYHFSALNRK
jgi:hypothetical protein